MCIAFHPYGLSVCLNEKAEDFGFTFEAIHLGTKKTGYGTHTLTQSTFFHKQETTKSGFHVYRPWYESQPNLSFGYGYGKLFKNQSMTCVYSVNVSRLLFTSCVKGVSLWAIYLG